MKPKKKHLFRKIWKFIWEDDSIYSWIVNIVLAYVLIKFIVYPTLGFVLSTTHPIVAVVSGSMEHDGRFDNWWSSRAACSNSACTQEEFYSVYGISNDKFKRFDFPNGFNKGDIMILYGSKPKNLAIGDVLIFKASRPDPIIHRIIKINAADGSYSFQTKGDHNSNSISSGDFTELDIRDDQIIAKAIFRVPYLGYIKIWFVELV